MYISQNVDIKSYGISIILYCNHVYLLYYFFYNFSLNIKNFQYYA